MDIVKIMLFLLFALCTLTKAQSGTVRNPRFFDMWRKIVKEPIGKLIRYFSTDDTGYAQTVSASSTTTKPIICHEEKRVIYEHENARPTAFKKDISKLTSYNENEDERLGSSISNTRGSEFGANAGVNINGVVDIGTKYRESNSQETGSSRNRGKGWDKTKQNSESTVIEIHPWHTYKVTQKFRICGKSEEPISKLVHSETPINGFEKKIREQYEFQKKMKRIQLEHELSLMQEFGLEPTEIEGAESGEEY